jgi:carbamoyl-phosphate synthase large subunit
MPKLRLLVLSVGTQVGQNVLTTLARRRDDLELIATSSVAHEPFVFDYDAVYLVPQTAAEPEAFAQRLLDIMARERVDLVIPCRDDDVVFLAGLRDRRPDLAPRLLCGSAEAARIIGDKWLSAEFCARHGLPFAPSIANGAAEHRAAFVREHGYPLVAKPRRGYASQDVYLISNDRQLEHALAREGWIVQKYLGDPRTVSDYLAGIETRGIPLYHTFQGFKHSIQALIAPDGAVTHVICTLNASRMRRSKRVEPDRDPRSRDIGVRCAQAFSASGWRGPLNIQCQKSADGTLFIHEFNGRFTGATVDRWLLGFDEVGAAIECFTGVPVGGGRDAPPVALEAFESLVARSADPRDVEALARDGVWRRAR